MPARLGAPDDRPDAGGRAGRERPSRASRPSSRHARSRSSGAAAGCARCGTSRPTSACSRSSRPGSSSLPTPGSHINSWCRSAAGRTCGPIRPSARARDGLYRIAVKRCRIRRGGSAYMWSLQPGAQLTISTPGNHFELSRSRPEYLLLAGGIGITPIFTHGAGARRGGREFPAALCLPQPRATSPWPTSCGSGSATGCSRLSMRRAPGSTSRRRSPGLRPAANSMSADRSACWRPPSALGSASGRPVDQLRFETFGNSGRFAVRAIHGEHPAPRHGDRRAREPDHAGRARSGRGRDDLRLPAGRVRPVRAYRSWRSTASSTIATSSSATRRRPRTRSSAPASPASPAAASRPGPASRSTRRQSGLMLRHCVGYVITTHSIRCRS